MFYWGNNLKDDKNNRTHHVCKNYIQSGCSEKGCHVITYKVDREAKDRTGRIVEAQIDEKVLNNQRLMKDRKRNENIK